MIFHYLVLVGMDVGTVELRHIQIANIWKKGRKEG
jgi:hypothetical protein